MIYHLPEASAEARVRLFVRRLGLLFTVLDEDLAVSFGDVIGKARDVGTCLRSTCARLSSAFSHRYL
jgi:hypothetical protein